jgi:HK97 family phage prohead protease
MQTKKTQHKIERRECGLVEVKLANDTAPGVFSGYGAVFNNTDSYGDVIAPGAFAESLGEWNGKGKFPPMLLQHGGMGVTADDMLPVGEWTSMSENRKGLQVTGRLFALNTERGQYIYEGLKAGALDGISIGYKVREQIEGTRPGEPDRTLTNIDLWEVSIVTFPANPKARIADVKNLTPKDLRDLEAALRKEGLSRADAERAVWGFRKWQGEPAAPGSASRDENAPDEAVDAAEQLLSRMCSALLRP